jgi:hypothetical protein
MEPVRFIVPGHPVGYYAEGAHPNWKRRNEYVAYKRTVQRCAVAAGLELPLRASRTAPLVIDVVPYFACGVHCDTENVRKGVADALFYVSKGRGKGSADKHTGGSFPPPLYDAANPRCEVTVRAVQPGTNNCAAAPEAKAAG